MKEQLITFDTGVIAKQKEFFDKNYYKEVRLSQDYFYDSGRILHSMKQAFSSQIDLATCYNAPTQSILQQWLRDTHQLHVIVAPRFYNDGSLWYVYECIDIKVNTIETLNNNLFRGVFQMYKTHEEALEEGLLEALKSIP